jgi:hypothetical protein
MTANEFVYDMAHKEIAPWDENGDIKEQAATMVKGRKERASASDLVKLDVVTRASRPWIIYCTM